MSPRAAFRCAEGWFQGSVLSIGRDERLLVRGQADACPSRQRRSRRIRQNLCVSASLR